jgi:hypothetical protein
LELVTACALVVYGVLAVASGLAHGQDVVVAPPVGVSAAASSWSALALQTVAAIVAVLVPAVGAYLTAVIRAKAKNEAEAAALVQLERHAEAAVLDVMQSIVRPARQSAIDGTPPGQIAPETARAAKAQAMSAVQARLTPTATRTLERAYGPDAFASVLDTQIEAAVEKVKTLRPEGETPTGGAA